jgi:hypothetical protein
MVSRKEADNSMTRIIRATLLLMSVLLAAASAGCGSKKASSPETGSFSMAVAAAASDPTLERQPAAQPSAQPVPTEAAAAGVPMAKVAQEATTPYTAVVTKAPVEPEAEPAITSPAPDKQSDMTAAAAPRSMPASKAAIATASAVKPADGIQEIKWSGFFDDDKQSTPAEQFWDMNGQTVSIKGYMGEVLSFEKSWFLVIPSPGAECPFDNGDEAYWNKIMIAFTDKGEKLRFTPGPLQITGRLDVGVMVDESGYKTMFRLYEAKLEKLKEQR